MSRKFINSLSILLFLFVAVSCEKSDFGSLGGNQSPEGEVGNSFSVSGSIPGVSGATAEVVDLTDGVSTLSYSVNVTNNAYLSMLSSLSNPNIAGSSITGEAKYRFSSKGIESVYNDGTLTLVKYDAKVGDIYTAKHNGATVRREVTTVSSEDDYFWGGMLIKTIEVKETGRGIPGVSEIRYRYNHKFGIVATKVNFEDGTSKEVRLYSAHSAN